MMQASAVLGILAALLTALPRLLWAKASGPFWENPYMILVVGAVLALLPRLFSSRDSKTARAITQRYDGLPDLFIHIHSPASPDSSTRWTVRGAISLALSVFGVSIGPEGAAIEGTHAFALKTRPRSARWFEQRRRTDAASCVAASISAAFGSPFAAILLPAELGMAGRILPTAFASLAAFLTGFVLTHLGLDAAWFVSSVRAGGSDGFHLLMWREWLTVFAVAIAAGVFGALGSRLVRFCRQGLLDVFKNRSWALYLFGAFLLFLIARIYPTGHLPPAKLFESLVFGKLLLPEVLLLFLAVFMGWLALLSCFGAAGVFWPLLLMGGLLGAAVDQWVFPGIPTTAIWIGGVALWSSFLGAPISASVLAFELTGEVSLLLPCLVAGFCARGLREVLRTRSVVDDLLDARGLPLIEGRSQSVLESIYVWEAMVRDHETVHEQDSLQNVQERLSKSRYPFLPVVSSTDLYRGLLTADMIQEGFQTSASSASLSKLLEAKDLLYRSGGSGMKSPTVRMDQRLSETGGLFEAQACIAVLDDAEHVVGLLFGHNVRNAYDREVARRSLAFQEKKE